MSLFSGLWLNNAEGQIMTKFFKGVVVAVILVMPTLGAFGQQAPPATQTSPDASAAVSADALLKQIVDMTPPQPDMSKVQDPAYVKEYTAQMEKLDQQRVALAAQFAEKYPTRPEAAECLFYVADRSNDNAQKLASYKKLISDYPTSQFAQMSAGRVHRLEAIGKPFELAFTDEITQKPVSVTDFKGKIVLVDFWATWCGPCVSAMPALKEYYEKHKDQVAILGVSLDEPADKGGEKALKDFVATNSIPWPQYYQGKGWTSEFSNGWGIDSIPCMFVVDADGKLAATDADIRTNLADIVDGLLKKK
jgi:thiol-disulfide isomerase/thioredoxin